MAGTLKVQGKRIAVLPRGARETRGAREDGDFISLSDIARQRNPDAPADVVKNWLRARGTIEFLGLWEQLNNPDFQPAGFERLKEQAGDNHFVLSPQQWIDATAAVGLKVRAGRQGGIYAHSDIAFEFASWLSPQFKLYLITEFYRQKQTDRLQSGWDIRRNLAGINYRLHTDAIKAHLLPEALTPEQVRFIYSTEADVLNMALFGKTARQWRDEHPDAKGNLRDQATAAQLICLSNLENINALLIQKGVPQHERLAELNQMAIQQMQRLVGDKGVKQLEENR